MSAGSTTANSHTGINRILCKQVLKQLDQNELRVLNKEGQWHTGRQLNRDKYHLAHGAAWKTNPFHFTQPTLIHSTNQQSQEQQEQPQILFFINTKHPHPISHHGDLERSRNYSRPRGEEGPQGSTSRSSCVRRGRAQAQGVKVEQAKPSSQITKIILARQDILVRYGALSFICK